MKKRKRKKFKKVLVVAAAAAAMPGQNATRLPGHEAGDVSLTGLRRSWLREVIFVLAVVASGGLVALLSFWFVARYALLRYVVCPFEVATKVRGRDEVGVELCDVEPVAARSVAERAQQPRAQVP